MKQERNAYSASYIVMDSRTFHTVESHVRRTSFFERQRVTKYCVRVTISSGVWAFRRRIAGRKGVRVEFADYVGDGIEDGL